jgi:prepilin-type N-terminal cleavage/methylation domain-containing protein
VRRPRASDERGFTLIELLVAMSIGTIVLLGAFLLLDRSFSASGQVADRVDALQQGRQTMELMTRQLRSQVCLGKTNTPIVTGTDNSVTFYADLTADPQNTKLRTLTYNPSPTNTITQTVVSAASGTYPNLVFAGGASVTTTLQTKVQPILDTTAPTTRPVFKYYRYKAGLPVGDLELMSAPLDAVELGQVAAIKVSFKSFAQRPISDQGDSTELEDDVYVRLSDPTEVQDGPICV